MGEEGFGTTKDYPEFHKQDGDTFFSWGRKVPFFQLYPESMNQVDLIKKGPDIDNFTTTKEVLKSAEEFTRTILELYGEKPQKSEKNEEPKAEMTVEQYQKNIRNTQPLWEEVKTSN
ncbi:hypothetical protein [uncultured Psychroserpens sp.]|uniref:hypothetical protein n=1 Tax=uncultured Psychroserpens sp. TaxID=255436 RepID=UPI00260E7347|nr:hypothetical protein [uncultured Psychroserpens sp.]